MHPELEALIKSWEARDLATDHSDRCFSRYEALLEDTAYRAGVPSAELHRAVISSYLRWVRAQQRVSTLPPKA